MSSAATLLNTPTCVCDLSTLEGEWLGVAGAGYRLPIAWIRMFEPGDLGPCWIYFQGEVDAQSEWATQKALISNPATSVTKALKRLSSSRRLFETLAGNAAVGREYWAAAVAQLEALPLPWLTIDARDLLLMDNVQTSSGAYARAFGDDESAIAIAKEMSCFREGFVAARQTDLDPAQRRDDGPANNAAALHGAFFEPQYRIRSSRTPAAKQRWDAAMARMPRAW